MMIRLMKTIALMLVLAFILASCEANVPLKEEQKTTETQHSDIEDSFESKSILHDSPVGYRFLLVSKSGSGYASVPVNEVVMVEKEFSHMPDWTLSQGIWEITLEVKVKDAVDGSYVWEKVADQEEVTINLNTESLSLEALVSHAVNFNDIKAPRVVRSLSRETLHYELTPIFNGTAFVRGVVPMTDYDDDVVTFSGLSETLEPGSYLLSLSLWVDEDTEISREVSIVNVCSVLDTKVFGTIYPKDLVPSTLHLSNIPSAYHSSTLITKTTGTTSEDSTITLNEQRARDIRWFINGDAVGAEFVSDGGKTLDLRDCNGGYSGQDVYGTNEYYIDCFYTNQYDEEVSCSVEVEVDVFSLWLPFVGTIKKKTYTIQNGRSDISIHKDSELSGWGYTLNSSESLRDNEVGFEFTPNKDTETKDGFAIGTDNASLGALSQGRYTIDAKIWKTSSKGKKTIAAEGSQSGYINKKDQYISLPLTQTGTTGTLAFALQTKVWDEGNYTGKQTVTLNYKIYEMLDDGCSFEETPSFEGVLSTTKDFDFKGKDTKAELLAAGGNKTLSLMNVPSGKYKIELQVASNKIGTAGGVRFHREGYCTMFALVMPNVTTTVSGVLSCDYSVQD